MELCDNEPTNSTPTHADLGHCLRESNNLVTTRLVEISITEGNDSSRFNSEILEHIAFFLTRATQAVLLRCCKTYYLIIGPILYKHVDLDLRHIASFRSRSETGPELLRHTSSLVIRDTPLPVTEEETEALKSLGIHRLDTVRWVSRRRWEGGYQRYTSTFSPNTRPVGPPLFMASDEEEGVLPGDHSEDSDYEPSITDFEMAEREDEISLDMASDVDDPTIVHDFVDMSPVARLPTKRLIVQGEVGMMYLIDPSKLDASIEELVLLLHAPFDLPEQWYGEPRYQEPIAYDNSGSSLKHITIVTDPRDRSWTSVATFFKEHHTPDPFLVGRRGNSQSLRRFGDLLLRILASMLIDVVGFGEPRPPDVDIPGTPLEARLFQRYDIPESVRWVRDALLPSLCLPETSPDLRETALGRLSFPPMGGWWVANGAGPIFGQDFAEEISRM